jgi:hypothetical protein
MHRSIKTMTNETNEYLLVPHVIAVCPKQTTLGEVLTAPETDAMRHNVILGSREEFTRKVSRVMPFGGLELKIHLFCRDVHSDVI